MAQTLKVKKREVFGKKLKKERENGQLPVVVYGPKDKPENYFVDSIDFLKVFREAGESTVIELTGEENSKDVLIHDVSYDPVSDTPIHVDFYAIEKGKKVEVAVPLEFIGVSPAVKNLSGILVKVLHELQIEAMPKDLPHEIEIDISPLVDFDSQILVKDVKAPEGVTILNDADEVVVLTNAPEEEKEEEEPIDMDSIEVEKKGKKEEEGEASGEEKKEE